MKNDPSLIIFANFRIDNEERYLRMKDSLLSFKNISAKKWIINVRGDYKDKTSLFLKNNLGKKLVCSQLESKYGWFYDTRKLLKEIDSDFVLFWLEDHINIANVSIYQEILNEMKQNYCEQLTYTWLFQERKMRYNDIRTFESKNIEYFDINEQSVEMLEKKLDSYFYTVSIPCIFSVDFFKKIIRSDHPFLKRWPKETPFDFEKKSTDKKFLNFRFAFPKSELFVSIDDNLYSNENYCMIDRGLYPNRVIRQKMLILEGREKKRLGLPESLKAYIRPFATIIKRIKFTLK